MRRLVPIALLLTSACATSQDVSRGGPEGPSRVISSGAQADVVLADDRSVAVATFAAPPERVWSAVREAYRALGIPEGTSDDASRTYGNTSFTVRRTLAGERLSRFVRCGEGMGGAPIADTYRIRLSVLSTVHPAPGGASRVETLVQASGQSLQASTSPVKCATSGKLERRIGELIAGHLQS